jgi:hypothetical protein
MCLQSVWLGTSHNSSYQCRGGETRRGLLDARARGAARVQPQLSRVHIWEEISSPRAKPDSEPINQHESRGLYRSRLHAIATRFQNLSKPFKIVFRMRARIMNIVVCELESVR